MKLGEELIMSYTVKSTEKLRRPASEAETKAMLYLMSFREDSDEIYYFVVDFFNDMTGMNRIANKLWDLQSKGKKNSSPREIGKELVTLFKNYISDFKFNHYILFLGGVTSTFRINDMESTFNISNIKPTALSMLKKGLEDECFEKTYIDNKKTNDENISVFLSKVLFVIDDKEPAEYVKAIIKVHPRVIPEKSILNAIFNEIRDEQASKKNIRSVEGVVLETTDEVLGYYRHLTNSEIRLMVLHRVINRNPLEQGVPLSFTSTLNQCPPERQKDMLDDCQSSLCRALFNKNVATGFWKLFENIYNLVIAHPETSVQSIFNYLDSSIIDSCPDLDVLSLKYFVAIVKDGIQS